MERVEHSDAYIPPQVLEAERALNPPLPPTGREALYWRIERYPWRLDPIDLFATIGEVLLWMLVGFEALIWLVPVLLGDPDLNKSLPIYLAYIGGIAAFTSVTYFSLGRYRKDFRRALENSNLSLQLAAGVIEGEQVGNASLLESAAPRRGSLESLVWHIAQHPHKFLPLKSFAFSRTWLWFYYGFAVLWFLACMGTTFVFVVTLIPPHAPWLELLLPSICRAHLRRVRYREVANYLSRMLNR